MPLHIKLVDLFGRIVLTIFSSFVKNVTKRGRHSSRADLYGPQPDGSHAKPLKPRRIAQARVTARFRSTFAHRHRASR